MGDLTYKLQDRDWQWVPEEMVEFGMLSDDGPCLDLSSPTGICAAVEVVRGRTGDRRIHLYPVRMESGVVWWNCGNLPWDRFIATAPTKAECALAALRAT